jgi:molecular chaperone GrpE
VQFDSTNESNSESNTNDPNGVIQELKKALAEEKAKGESNLAGWQRAQADFVNFRRHAEQEKIDLSKFANVGLLVNILPVFDDLERALAAMPHGKANPQWLEGLKLIDRKFRDVLEKVGLCLIPTAGLAFDPGCMEALACQAGKKDFVILELEKGYRLHDKVIRPAKVIVGSGEEEPVKED